MKYKAVGYFVDMTNIQGTSFVSRRGNEKSSDGTMTCCNIPKMSRFRKLMEFWLDIKYTCVPVMIPLGINLHIYVEICLYDSSTCKELIKPLRKVRQKNRIMVSNMPCMDHQW